MWANIYIILHLSRHKHCASYSNKKQDITGSKILFYVQQDGNILLILENSYGQKGKNLCRL